MVRRIPVAVALPIVIAAFSAGVAASLWQQDDMPEPAHSASAPMPASPAAPEPIAGTAAVQRPPRVDELQRGGEETAPVTPSLPVALRNGRGERGVEGRTERPGPVSFTKPETAPSDAAPRDVTSPARPLPEVKEEVVRSDPDPAEVAEPEIRPPSSGREEAARPSDAARDIEIAAPAFAHPVGPPADLKAASGKVSQRPKASYRAPPKRQTKLTEMPIFGPLFGWKY